MADERKKNGLSYWSEEKVPHKKEKNSIEHTWDLREVKSR